VSRCRWVVLEPLDTIVVRDGRAFDAGVNTEAQTVPPTPSTVAGAIGAAYGVLFVALTRNIESMAAKIAAGLAYGAAVYLFMTFLVMPWANPVMYATIDKGLFFLIHLAYGATLPVALPMRRGAPTARRREAPAR